MKFYPAITAAFLSGVLALTVFSSAVQATAAAPGTVSVVDDPSVQPAVPVPQGADTPIGDASNTGAPIVTTTDPVAPVPSQVMPSVPSDIPVPDSAALETPAPAPALGASEVGESAAGSPLGDTGARAQHSGQYYDSMALVPDSNLEKAGVTGPRKVDPVYEPGQRYISVQRDAGPTAFESQYVAATRALKLGRYAAAMEMFEKLYRQNHNDQRVLMGLAVAQQGAGFIESAARTYEELLSIAPDNADAAVNLMGIMKAQYPSVTLQNLMELRGKYPTNPGIPAQIGLVNAEMQNYDDALRYLEIAASMDPRNASHIYNMAIIADRKGDIRGAISYYQRALELDSAYSDNASALPRDQIYDRLATLRQKV